MSYSSEVLARSAVGAWTFDETSGTDAADYTGNGNLGTYVTSPTLGAAGLVSDGGTAVETTGSAYISLPFTGSGGAWSFVLWYKFTATASPMVIWRDNTLSGSQGWYVRLDTTNVEWKVDGTARSSTTPSSSYKDGQRHQFILTADGTTARLYADGVLIDSFAQATTAPPASPIRVGRNGGNGQYVPGVYDAPSIHNVALTAADASALWTAGTTSTPATATGSVSATLPALTASASGTVATPTIMGAVDATLPALSASVAGTVAEPPSVVTGDVAATLPSLTAAASGDVAAPSTDVVGTVAATLPSLSASVSGTVGDAAEQIGFGFGFGMRVTDRRTTTPDPRTNLPQYRLVAVDMYGTQLAELHRASIGPIEDEVNGAGGFTFTVGSRDPKARHVMPRHGYAPPEVQVWRGDQLVAWCVVKVARPSGLGLYTFDCVGLRWYYSKRFIDRRPRRFLFRNGTFGSGLMWWDTATASGTITASVVASERGIDGKAVRLENAGTNVYGRSGATARHLRQRRRITQPVALQAPLPIRATLDMRVLSFGAPSLLGYAVRLIAVSVTDLATIVDTDEVEMTELSVARIDADTPRDRWHEVTLEVEVPANGVEHIVELRLVPPGTGVAEFTNIDVSPAEQLGYFDDDQAWIVGNLSDNAQDSQWGKGSLNIGRHTPLTGVLRTREYEFADHRPYLDAMNEYPALAHGVEWDILSDGRNRWIQTFFPFQGSASDVVLALGANVVDYDATVDLDNAANSVVVQGLTLGGSDRKERHALNAGSMGGAILEGVIMADEETPLPELDEAARQALAEMGSPAPTLRVTCHPRYTSDLIARLDKGDTCRAIVSDGMLDEDGTARAMRRRLDPNIDGLTYDLVWEA